MKVWPAATLLVTCLVSLIALARPARAKTRIFPLPMYTTVPNEGNTFGFMPVFLRTAGEEAGIQAITAPSLSWNRSAGITGTYRYFRYLNPVRAWRFLISGSTNINRSIWFQYDDDRRDEGTSTVNVLVRVRRNLFYRYFGLGPDSSRDAESSHTRLASVVVGRWGRNLTRDWNLGAFLEFRGDRPERHTIGDLPATQDLHPDAPGLSGAALVRQGASLRYDTREGGDYAVQGVVSELTASIAEGIVGAGVYGQVTWHTRALLREASFLQLAGRVYWTQLLGGSEVPFYDQATLGGELLLRGFPEDRFIDRGAWTVELEQRVRVVESRLFGVLSHWRIDPFVAAGQVYGEQAPWSHVRLAAGAGLRVWVSPNVLGRIDLAYAGEGIRAYVVLGYPF